MRTLLRIPVNVLMFCRELSATPEEFAKKMAELAEEKVAGAFELDAVRIGSMPKLQSVVSSEGSVRVYGAPGGAVLAGTEFETGGGEVVQAFIQINTSNIGQSYLSVYSAVREFREVVARNLLDLLVRVK